MGGKNLGKQKQSSTTQTENMDNISFNFNHAKGTQALNYFAINEGGQINKMKALKLVFLADRYHIRKYGRLITNDNYLAMQHGPVPSAVKDIAESNDYLDDTTKDYSLKFIEPVDNRVLKSVNKLEKSVLSKSDLEALEFAWDNFGHLDQFQLRDLTHLYPEWEKYRDSIDSKSCILMQVLDFLQDPTDTRANKCFDLTEQDKVIRREQIIELAHIEALWR
jgi:uncharacterized phage-associated protein